jgi:Tol biopolymer transport system component
VHLTAGQRLGAFEILAPLGAGGMGEVYRARDTRLGREVAIKVLPPPSRDDSQAVARLEREARAVAALSHPNVVSLYDFVEERGVTFAVMEMLRGENLRQRLEAGRLTLDRAIGIVEQACQGVGAAHEAGIVHRDIKPENLLLTEDGVVKVLDFGLARLAERAPLTEGETATAVTSAGTILGTVGYMSPEQVRGAVADARSDLFSLGVVLYEAATGRRAFTGNSAVETLNAILTDEPAFVDSDGAELPKPLGRILRRCLEKKPSERFQSARDLGFALRGLMEASAPASGPAIVRRPARPLAIILVSGFAAAAALGAWAVSGLRYSPRVPSYERLTFHRGTIANPRFAADARTVLFTAWLDGRPADVFRLPPGEVEPRAYGFRAGTELLAPGPQAEMAIKSETGVLARVSTAGGLPRELAEGVMAADWSRDGQGLVLVRWIDERRKVIERPLGKTAFETAGWISEARVSPSGRLVAFMSREPSELPAVRVLDEAGRARILSAGWRALRGLAWSRDGREIWFTGSRDNGPQALWAVSLEAEERLVASWPGNAVLGDVASDGRVLIALEEIRYATVRGSLVTGEERDVSWLNGSVFADATADGGTVLLSEVTLLRRDSNRASSPSAEDASADSVYLRRLDGSPAIRLGDGDAVGLSPDRGQVLVEIRQGGRDRLVLLPTGPGSSRTLDTSGLDIQRGKGWFPDGKRVFFWATSPGRPPRSYGLHTETGEVVALTPEGVVADLVSPDGQRLIGRDGVIHSIAGQAPLRVFAAGPNDKTFCVAWSTDERSLYCCEDRYNDLPWPLYRIEIASGRRTLLRELAPPDLAGVQGLETVGVTRDGKTYFYSYKKTMTDLYIAQGLQ